MNLKLIIIFNCNSCCSFQAPPTADLTSHSIDRSTIPAGLGAAEEGAGCREVLSLTYTISLCLSVSIALVSHTSTVHRVMIGE